MSQITTHILDTSMGKPAAAVTVVLYAVQEWAEMAKGITNTDGRIPHLLKADQILKPGAYKLRFETKEYFDKRKVATFYPYVEITFEITGNEHYHIPLLISPFGYSTYRGS